MSGATVRLLSEAEGVRLALDPVRRDLLERMRTPKSATALAAETGLPRQRLGHHLRALEAAGLVELAEERPRRGFTERVLVATAERFLLDPELMAPSAREVELQDRHAAAHLIAAAAETVREVARMQTQADREGSRLLTFTIEADVTLARPGDLDALAEALGAAVGAVADRFNSGEGRRYRLLLGGRPASKGRAASAKN